MSAMICTSHTVAINRTQPFDPVRLLGPDFTIEGQDERSLALPEINLADVQLKHMLKRQEASIKGEEMLRRLNEAEHVCLDAKIFQTLWEDKALIPAGWKKGPLNIMYSVLFLGTVLCGPNGDRFVLCLFYFGDQWKWQYLWLKQPLTIFHRSAVLTNI